MNCLINLYILSSIGSCAIVLGQELQFSQPEVCFGTLKNGGMKSTVVSNHSFTYPNQLTENWTPYVPGEECGFLIYDGKVNLKPKTDSSLKPFINGSTRVDCNGPPTPEVKSELNQKAETVEDTLPDLNEFSYDFTPEVERELSRESKIVDETSSSLHHISRTKKEASDETRNGDILFYDVTPEVKSELNRASAIVEETFPALNHISRAKKETSNENRNGGTLLYDVTPEIKSELNRESVIVEETLPSQFKRSKKDTSDESGYSCGEEDSDSSESKEDKVHVVKCYTSWRDTPENLRNAQLDLKTLRKGEKWYHRTQLQLIPLSESESTEEVKFEVMDFDEVKQMIEAQMKNEVEAMTKALEPNKKSESIPTEDTKDQRRQSLLLTKSSLETQLYLFEEYLNSNCVNADELDVRVCRIEPLLDEYFQVIHELTSLPTPIPPETITKFEQRYYTLLALANTLSNRNTPNPTTEGNLCNFQPVTTCQLKSSEISPDECQTLKAASCPSIPFDCKCNLNLNRCNLWRVPSDSEESLEEWIPCNITRVYPNSDECSDRTILKDPCKCLLATRNKCPAIKFKSHSVGSTTSNAKISTCLNRNGNSILFKRNQILKLPKSERVIVDKRVRLHQTLLKSASQKHMKTQSE